MRYWLSRLGFSFIVVAFAVAYMGWQAGRNGTAPLKVNLHYVAAAVLLGVGLAGLRERHRK